MAGMPYGDCLGIVVGGFWGWLCLGMALALLNIPYNMHSKIFLINILKMTDLWLYTVISGMLITWQNREG